MDDSSSDPLSSFLPPVAGWFSSHLGQPTQVQTLAWPSIRAGNHTLLLAPTGSGKTLAAFLVCLDLLWRQKTRTRGVKVLYISPLKALNNDIQRNLAVPLEGIQELDRTQGGNLDPITTAVRTGDTPVVERQRQIRQPADILITTPESLHLLLTSKGRGMLGGVTHVIVDEIHAVCSNKRGVFLSVLLERLEEIRFAAARGAGVEPTPLVRIGLSATQRPLEEVARFLGGYQPGSGLPRPVRIIDAGIRKEMDLLVQLPVEAFGPQPDRSVWPSIYRLIREQVQAHRSTIVFANDRRAVEKITAWVNEESELAQSHHGSVSLEKRRQTEEALKQGQLPAVVATASLEMGIDMGAVDLVVQVESPGSVSRALQRVGRAGHVVGQKSKGRMIPKTQPDLLEMAVLAREMKAGKVEEIRIPLLGLDILCQQIVAMVAMEDWDVESLLRVFRRAAPFRDLTPVVFEQALELVSGRFRFSRSSADGKEKIPARGATLEALQPRLSWDRIHNRLRALPGSRHLALTNGGAIPDTGNFAVMGPGGSRIGELDEEFIYERRVGDTFLLGTTAWRIEKIEADRVFVTRAEGELAQLPFWRGEGPGRTLELGKALGGFLREVEARLDDSDRLDWLCNECFLDRPSARAICQYLTRQLLSASVIPNDRTILVESSRDSLGDWQVMVLSPLGSRFHLGLRLALEGALKERLGYRPKIHHHDDGLVVRVTDTDAPPLDLLDGLDPDSIEDTVLRELGESPLFAIRFRQNASRGLLLPRAQPGKRSPLWLQRIRGRDLLQVARQHPDFPMIAETYRECLSEHIELEGLREVLRGIRKGDIRVVKRRAEAPCPFAHEILFQFTAEYMYQTDQVEPESRGPTLDRELLDQLLTPGEATGGTGIATEAIRWVENRIRGLVRPPRSEAEMAETLRRVGDLATAELHGPMEAFLGGLEQKGEAVRFALPGRPFLWIPAEQLPLYQSAFSSSHEGGETERNLAATTILEGFLTTHALIDVPTVLARYPWEEGWVVKRLEEWAGQGRALVVEPTPSGTSPRSRQWTLPDHYDQLKRSTLSLFRKEIRPVSLLVFQNFLFQWQRVGAPAVEGNLESVLDQLEGVAVPLDLWENALLPSRLPGFSAANLDRWCESGLGVWVGHGSHARGVANVSFHPREHLSLQPAPQGREETQMGEWPSKLLVRLQQQGAAFVTDLSLATDLDPSQTREALWELASRGLVSNDQIQVVRTGRQNPTEIFAKKMRDGAIPRGPTSARFRMPRISPRSLIQPGAKTLEGRWSAIDWGHPDIEAHALFVTEKLLNRYGVLSREIVHHAGSPVSWKILYEILCRMELTGSIRRGFLVEGLEGAQFALAEAVDLLRDLERDPVPNQTTRLIHAMDPCGIVGLFDEGEGVPQGLAVARRASNWWISVGGQPILALENHGKHLHCDTQAQEGALREALKCFASHCSRLANLGGTPGRLSIESWNGQPVIQSSARPLLTEVGFVSDFQHLTRYLGAGSS